MLGQVGIAHQIEDYAHATAQAVEKPFWDFPVEKRRLYFEKNNGEMQESKKSFGIIRTDKEEHLATVGPAYKIVTHQEILDLFDPYVKLFGEASRTITMSPNGARVAATYTFKNITKEVAKGDRVGFVLHAIGGYDGKTAVKLSVAGIRLACLNGMVSHEKTINLSYAHNDNKILDMQFPNSEAIIDMFDKDIARWSRLTEAPVNWPDQISQFENHILTTPGLISPSREDNFVDKTREFRTAWDAYNYLTHEVTHVQKTNLFTKLNRLRKINNAVEMLIG